uniref:Secreted protein n=1 Tax=Setaria viridis TaxID=4556 RepID=A0A4U6SXA2_SETVI|nr:hypothetical protein SEVIR_9G177275v2 [Setaria viridis]
MVRLFILLVGPAAARATHARCHSVDVGVVLSLASRVDDFTSITGWPEPLAHMRMPWGRCWVGLRRDRDALPRSRWLL